MNAVSRIAAPVDRLTHWLRGSQTPLHTMANRARARFAAVGDFLFAHDLDPSAANYAVALAYLDGYDARLCAAIDRMLTAGQPLTSHALEPLAARLSSTGQDGGVIDALAKELEARVGDCVGAISESFASTDAYSRALGDAAGTLNDSPQLTYHRLISLTLDVAETTRKIAGRMEAVQLDTRRLQDELEQARRAAEEDHLTGLYNRRGFMDRLQASLVARPDAMRVIALCDIDDFKVVNDRHGHAVGDRVLTYVGRHLRQQLGNNVLVGRHGGEEFACLFEDVAPARAVELLDGVRGSLRTRTLRDQASGEPIGMVTFSAGLACLDFDPDQAFRNADAALYAAKRGGKDQVSLSG